MARGLGLAALGVLALLVLAIALFPFERLGPLLAAAIESETRVAATFDSVDVGAGLRGPVLRASGITLAWPTGEQVGLDALEVQAARPIAWLRGIPTLHVVTHAPFGSFDGDVSREAVAGRLSALDPARLPPEWFGEAGSPLAGPVEATVDLRRLADQWSGSVRLQGGEGSLALPGSPVAIPYQRLRADAEIDAVGTLRIAALELEGPMLSARAQGEIAAGYAGPATGPIAIDAEVSRLDPALAPILEQYGVPLEPGRVTRLSISGTPDRLEIR